MPASELAATATLRKDTWWLEPLLIVLGLGGFVVYTTWAGLQGAHYEYQNYLSPFYSPTLTPSWWPPPACAVRDAHAGYTGETGFPLILQNLHRYFFYVATAFLIFLWYDAIYAFIFDGRFGIGLGSIIMVVNVALLSMYSFSCHSCRHLCGGCLDTFSSSPLRYRLWRMVTGQNERHMLWAWLSLVSVALTDVYIRLLSMGILRDVRFF